MILIDVMFLQNLTHLQFAIASIDSVEDEKQITRQVFKSNYV